MNQKSESRKLETSKAFTLIELLVVIAVIAVLAGLLFSAMPAINGSRMRSVARAELTQITTAIESFKSRYGNYPPDNPNNPAINPLYYELTGAVLRNSPAPPTYLSLDGTYSVGTNVVVNVFKIPGLINSATSAQGGDDRRALENFLKVLKPAQLGTNNGARILVCSADDSPWNYRSTNPTNNPGSYDLWIDLVAGGKTNRIANWNK